MQKKSIIISVIIVAIIGAYFIFTSMSNNSQDTAIEQGQETESVQEAPAEGATVEGAAPVVEGAATPVQEPAPAVEGASAPAAK